MVISEKPETIPYFVENNLDPFLVALLELTTGTISIDISKNEEGLLMNVRDNGIGIKSDDPLIGSDSFGYHLIKAFQRKLNADLEISGTNGTSISMLIRNYKIAA